jgi:hypothetical protein
MSTLGIFLLYSAIISFPVLKAHTYNHVNGGCPVVGVSGNFIPQDTPIRKGNIARSRHHVAGLLPFGSYQTYHSQPVTPDCVDNGLGLPDDSYRYSYSSPRVNYVAITYTNTGQLN